jgi:hypothetical protein
MLKEKKEENTGSHICIIKLNKYTLKKRYEKRHCIYNSAIN